MSLTLFDEINNHSLDENAHRVANNAATMNPEVSVASTADAELSLYKQEPSIWLKKDDGSSMRENKSFCQCWLLEGSLHLSNICPFRARFF
jgi:hypothetical protein